MHHGRLPKLFGGVRFCPRRAGPAKRGKVVFLEDREAEEVHGPARRGDSFGNTKVRSLYFQIVTAKPADHPAVQGADGSCKGVPSLLRGAFIAVRAMAVTARIVAWAACAWNRVPAHRSGRHPPDAGNPHHR
ncbi:hypothetical protein Sfulv_48020 [Streptomyces fulvorobeus]|uniref:Uncharacterized protein n=1 Tax=Streptomyces fulvorobeus TaxID=284028 RepID=A0A7J0CBW1_9ACTN|nr:hypothetical protein Sfulv_48020 [Streptomyces fulvorobeus]